MIISTERYRGKFRALLRRRFLSHRWHRKDHRAAIKRHVIAIPRSLLPTHREKEKKREREREGGREREREREGGREGDSLAPRGENGGG